MRQWFHFHSFACASYAVTLGRCVYFTYQEQELAYQALSFEDFVPPTRHILLSTERKSMKSLEFRPEITF